jgi:hypothetical protein
MADTTVYSSIIGTLDESNNLWGPYWTDKDTGTVVFISSGNEAFQRRTVDGGSSWSGQAIIFDGTIMNVACWYDQETPGDSGTILHVVTLDTGGACKYRTVNISTGVRGTQRTVVSGLTVSSTKSENRIAITKTVSGNIIVAYSTQSEIGCLKSDDLFATAGTSIADPFETPTEEDWLLLYPANTGDDNDACGIFWDRSANKISIKMYDDSEDDWTETENALDRHDNLTYINMDGAVRHSDRKIMFVSHTDPDTVVDVLVASVINPNSIDSPSFPNTSLIYNSQAESAQCSVLINQQNDDVYVAYLKGGTWLSEMDIVFHKSDDGMSTWGSEQAYNETTDDNRLVHGGRTIGDSGGRVQWSWYNDDLADIFVNLVNDIEISAVSGVINPKIKIGGTFSTKTIKTKISGTFVEKPILVKVGGTFQ